MHIEIDQDVFLEILSHAQSVLERKTTRPILETVLLQADAGALRLCATDLRISLSQEARCSVIQLGSVAVTGRKLYEIIRELPKERVDLELQENKWLSVRAGRAVFHLPATSPDEYPSVPASPALLFLFDAVVFREMLEKTLFAVSSDETRMYLCGVFMKQSVDSAGIRFLTMVATDGHRLSLVDRPFEIDIPGVQPGVVIPKKGLSELRSLLEGKEGPFEMGLADGQIFARVGRSLLSVLLIDEPFPNYQQVIPEQSAYSLTIDRIALIEALRRVALLSDVETHSVIMKAEAGRTILTSANPLLGDGREEMETTYEGEEIRLAFNASYALEALRSLEGKNVIFSLTDPLAPCLLRGDSDPNHLCVIMPMRID